MKINKSIKIITTALIAISLSSCGGGKKSNETVSVEVKPESTEVEGYLGDYLEIVEGSYKAEKDNSMIFSWIVKVKVKAIAVYDESDYGFKDGSHGPLSLDLYDDKGTPLTGFDNLESDYTCDSKLADILKAGSGETWVTFSKFHIGDVETFPENINGFVINSVLKEKQEDSAIESTDNKTSASEDNENMSSASTNKDYDKVLEDYDAYVDDYLNLIKKVNKGDQTAIAEYPELMKKAQSLSESLETAKKSNSLSSSQIKKMVKIQTKMMTASMELQKK